MKPTRTWIVIADSGRARVLENLGPGKGIHPVPGLELDADLPARTHDIVDDERGRTFQSVGPGRSGKEPPTDPRDKLKTEFLDDLVSRLDRRRIAGEFDRLILVAEPKALGKLRALLPDRLGEMVEGELDKDLTKTPDRDLPDHLEGVIRL